MPVESDDDFYDLTLPAELQQGDIIPDAPLISVPPSEHLIVLRDAQTNARLEFPNAFQQVKLIHEQALDAFPELEPEHILVSARRGPAMIVTQTCDLLDNQNWLICPMYSLEGSDVKELELFSDDDWKQHYPTLFGLPAHPEKYFEKQYIDLADMRSVYGGSIRPSNRIASLTPLKQARLNDKISRMFSRMWGYSTDEIVPRDGKYRCNLCNRFFGINNTEIDLTAGSKFPPCPNCAKIRKRPQWYLLRPHQKF